MRSFSLFILFLCCLNIAEAQRKHQRDTSAYIHQLNRIEFDMDAIDGNYHIISGKDDGLLVAIQTTKNNSEGYSWHLHKLDTSLNVVWSRLLTISFESTFTGYDYFDGKFYLLFYSAQYAFNKLRLYEIGDATDDINVYDINTIFPITLTEFEVLGQSALLSGHTNYRPVMLTYDFVEKKPKVLPGIYDKNGDILDLVTNDEMELFTVMVSDKAPNKLFSIVAKTFTAKGDLIQENTIGSEDKKSLVNGVSTSFNGGYQYIAGTYSKNASQYSRGLYLSKFANGRQQFIKYHDYSSLNNFFGYMNTKREQRVKDRIKRRAENGKNTNFNYRLYVHDIIKRGNEYLLVGEAYYPRYSSYSSGAYSQYARYTPTFLGYNFTHAIVVAFDQKGDIIWDNSFAIDNVLTYNLEEFVSVNIYQDKVVLMYMDKNNISTKVVSGDKIIEGKTFNPVKLSFEGDELKSHETDLEGLKSWYDKTMFAFGEQRIKNEKGAGGKVYRNIFYINKVQYQEDEN
jgi:hypothetical protein